MSPRCSCGTAKRTRNGRIWLITTRGSGEFACTRLPSRTRLRLVALEHRLRLVERGLERAGIDLEQQLSGRDVVALVERHTRQYPRHLRLDRRRLARLDRARA